MSANFICEMERVLTTYARPYDPLRPVICFDERPCFLIGDVLLPLPMTRGMSKREDYTYSKHGSCAVLMAFEPHTGKRWVKVYQQRTAKEYADFIGGLERCFPQAESITLVQDNLNTHHGGSFYKHLEAEEAHRLANKFEWIYTPKHASWLNMIEIEFSVLSRQCLDRRIPDQQSLTQEVEAWVAERNRHAIKVKWRFSVENAREKLGRHYNHIKT